MSIIRMEFTTIECEHTLLGNLPILCINKLKTNSESHFKKGCGGKLNQISSSIDVLVEIYR